MFSHFLSSWEEGAREENGTMWDLWSSDSGGLEKGSRDGCTVGVKDPRGTKPALWGLEALGGWGALAHDLLHAYR